MSYSSIVSTVLDMIVLIESFKCSVDLTSKTSSCHSSTAGLARDHIEHIDWDRSKLNISKLSSSAENDGEDDPKIMNKEDHPLVKYIKFQVYICFDY